MADPPGLDPRLLSAAEEVADQSPIDWGGRAEASPALRGAFDCLREIEALRVAHERLHSIDGTHEPGLFAWGPLRALEALGAGSFGEVYRAWDGALQREVALKLRRADMGGNHGSTRRWLEEARRLARVRHPNVVLVHGADERAGRAGLWTELVRGQTLEEALQANGPLGSREAALVGIDLCGALSAVHAAGLVHGDVTLRNVMREGAAGVTGGSGRIVLMDFGSAHDAGSAASITFGTPLYAAPEVLAGTAPSPTSDVYAVGVALYRLATGRYPYDAATHAQVRERILRGERTPLRSARPDLPAPFTLAVERACDPDPARRFTSPAELERALAETLPRTLDATRQRTRTGLVIATAIGVLALGGMAWWSTQRASRRESPHASGAAPNAGAGLGVAPVPPPTATPAPATTLVVEAALYRGRGDETQPLADGGRVRPGDRLWLGLRAPESVHVYVLDEDETGALYLLFPMSGARPVNPLSARAEHRLPGMRGGERLSWQVTSAGGRETFLIVAARSPLPRLERLVAALPRPSEGAPVTYASITPADLAELRGIGGVVAEPRLGTKAGRLRVLARSLERAGVSSGTWLRLLEVENPAR